MGQGANYSACIKLAKVNAAGVLADAAKGFREVGEAFPFIVSFPSTITKFMGGNCQTRALVVDTMETPGEPTGSMTFFDYTAENVNQSLGGVQSTNATAGSTLSAEAVTIGKYGYGTEIGFENLDSDIVVQDVTDTETYVNFADDPANADYKIDLAWGIVTPLSTGDMTEGEVLHFSGTELPDTSERITIKKGDAGLYAIKTTGKNNLDGSIVKDHFYVCRLVATNEITIAMAPDSTNRAQLDFEIIPQIPTGGNSYGTIDGLPVMAGS